MLTDAEVTALIGASHPDPFAVLGQHADADGALWVRALLPDALDVSVLDATNGRQVATLTRRHPAGFFEGKLSRRKQRFDYRLRVSWPHGETTELADAYEFGPLLHDADLHYLAEGSHLRPWQVLGAMPMTLGEGAAAVAGVRFAVWAPNARRVSVVGNFNNWDGRRHPMRHRGASGIWEIFVPHVTVGDHYKFEIVAADGSLLPLKADP